MAEAVAWGPMGGEPVAVAVLVKLAVTSANEHEYPASLAPAARVPGKVSTQFGAMGSATDTSVSGTVPVLVTTMVQEAELPDRMVWLAGSLVMPMPGASTTSGSLVHTLHTGPVPETSPV